MYCCQETDKENVLN